MEQVVLMKLAIESEMKAKAQNAAVRGFARYGMNATNGALGNFMVAMKLCMMESKHEEDIVQLHCKTEQTLRVSRARHLSQVSKYGLALH